MAARAHPDRARGVFETLLVLDGEPVELEAHLERLAASLAALYGTALPAGAAGRARDAAADLRHGRLRLTATPRRDAVALDAAARPLDPRLSFPPPRTGAALRPHPLPGGLGPHKWVDRTALPEPAAAETPLLVEADGEVLEAGWANVFAVRGGVLHTPPLDGRILPGVTRARAIELALAEGIEVRERPLPLAELREADEVLLTNSVRGIEAARSLGDAPLPSRGEVGATLSAALRERWRTAASPSGVR